MFDQILQLVKDHMGNSPELSSLPPEQAEAVHQEIATHINNGLQNQATSSANSGGLLSSLQNTLTSGSPVVNAIEGGLVSSLANKFGLSPMITGAISASLPGLLNKFANKAKDPNDQSITAESINNSYGSNSGGLGSLLGNL